MAINYNDSRFAKVEEEKQQALTQNEQLYTGMINESDKYYQAQIDAQNQWEKTQTDLQNQQTQFTIDKIEQQKEQAHKDYIKEQTASHVDYTKATDRYGANAEQLAAMGLTKTGFNESSLVKMFNTYQNRVSTARASFDLIKLDFENGIREAKLQNNVLLAEISYKAQQQRLELSLQNFQYKNQLLLEKADKALEINNTYYARYQDVVNQINTENALLEEQRQFAANQALKEREMKLAEEKFAYQKQQDAIAAAKVVSGAGGSSGSKASKNVKSALKTVGNKLAEAVKSQSSTPKYDMNSLNACAKMLGKKSLTAKEAANYVNAGILRTVEKNGVIGFTANVASDYWQNRWLPSSARKKLGLKG